MHLSHMFMSSNYKYEINMKKLSYQRTYYIHDMMLEPLTEAWYEQK